MMELPKRYNPKESEHNWQRYWQEQKIFAFDAQDKKKEIYSVDTPPPTVSGKMHLGHAFSYTQQDFMVRFHRMLGKNVFYPFGTDNNGVATERLIEKLKKVKAKQMERQDFVKLCLKTIKEELIPQYTEDMKKLGLSCDFSLFYNTIDPHSQKISQKSFIDLYKKGREYRKDAPTMWCPACETGISQVECEDKKTDSYFNDIVFKVKNSEDKEQDLVIATTRPELLPACVAVFYHPEDKRYQNYNGKKAKVPLFDFEVPILPDSRADPEKGTGIVMCCTFGDQTDMEWQKAHSLPIKLAISPDGKMTAISGKYKGMTISPARKAIIEDLKTAGLLLSQKPIKHAVNVHERCGTEIEYLKAKQWFIKYLDLKEEMLKWGSKLNWFPHHMKSRYDHWVKGLQWDWMISRQRFFGVPFPLWYCKKCGEVILAKEEDLPVDPIKHSPPSEKCPKCGSAEFTPEKDIMDTWATSSLTPQIAAQLIKDKAMQEKLYPMSLRPQAHDIITFWLFNTVVKSRLHNGVNPWKDVAISGHAQDPHGKKMSKSKGNVVEPQEMIRKYSADALRFWAAGSKLGDDLPFQEKDLVTGQKFITKLWNASKFAFMHLEDYDLSKPDNLELIDRWVLSKLSKLVKSSTESFMNYEYSKTKLNVEKFFWHKFCDNYLEIVKDRLYNPGKRGKEARSSAQYSLYNTLSSILKMMAPIMPHITEDIYQLYFAKKENRKSIHISDWPQLDFVDDSAEKIGDFAIAVIEHSRRAKSEKKVSLKASISQMFVRGKMPAEDFEKVKPEIKASTKAEIIEYEQLPAKSEAEFACELEL
ncbi:valine--tRNA ligase [Candidatus Woesearchaeota archaeon]|nr:valine--tRNA ligase [Candidatus Woesearchaeota archaeon]